MRSETIHYKSARTLSVAVSTAHIMRNLNSVSWRWTANATAGVHVPTHPIPSHSRVQSVCEHVGTCMGKKGVISLMVTPYITSHLTSSCAAADVFCIFTQIQLNKTTENKTLCSVSQKCSHSHIMRA